MGENKHIKELDVFAKKYVKEIKRQKPSIDFTASVMNTIVAEQQQKSIYKTTTLISKKVWFLLISLFVAVPFIPLKIAEKSLLQIPKVDFSFFDKIQIPSIFSSISISNITLFAILLFAFMVMVQVVFLKKHFDKRIH